MTTILGWPPEFDYEPPDDVELTPDELEEAREAYQQERAMDEWLIDHPTDFWEGLS